MTFIRELRRAVLRSENLLTRCQLTEHADRIDAFVYALYRSPTVEALQRLTGEWTRAYWAMDRAGLKELEKHDEHDKHDNPAG